MSFHGRFALGQKTASAQEPGLLGDERDDIAVRLDPATDMFYSINSGRTTLKWVRNNSGADLQPGSIVSYDVTGNLDTDVLTAVTATTPAGIVDPFLSGPVKPGERFLMVVKASRLPGVLCNVSVTKGTQLVQHATNGTAISGGGTALRAIEASVEAPSGTHRATVSCNFVAI